MISIATVERSIIEITTTKRKFVFKHFAAVEEDVLNLLEFLRFVSFDTKKKESVLTRSQNELQHNNPAAICRVPFCTGLNNTPID